jgi:hypothetical protein
MSYSEFFNELEQWRDGLRARLSPDAVIRALEQRYDQEIDPDRQNILNFLLVREHLVQGRPEAAEALQSRDADLQVRDWYMALRKGDREADLIPIIEERLRRETHPRKVRALRHSLAIEYMKDGNDEAAAAVHLKDATENPSDPLPLMALASLNSWEDPEGAMRSIDQAIDIAMRTRRFRRQALGDKARMALRNKDYRAVEDVLRQLLTLTFTRRDVDCGVERDFLDRLPQGSIDHEVARQYDEYCRARGKLPEPPGGPDEPPKWEPPEWETGR